MAVAIIMMVIAGDGFASALAGTSAPAQQTDGRAVDGLVPNASVRSAGARLLEAYPELLSGFDGSHVIWTDGTRMPIDDGRGSKPFGEWLDRPDLEDMLQKPYAAGAPATPPGTDHDPGRARNAEFFGKMYGNCLTGEVTRHLVDIVWLPSKSGQKLKVTAVNGVASALDAISRALDTLPSRFNDYLIPPAGTYVCRVIAGTDRVSAHGYGIAIDIGLKHADYWRWVKPEARRHVYRNRVPREIVDIFEANGFIWGGRWYHYDTMHFEYRPELLEGYRPRLRP